MHNALLNIRPLPPPWGLGLAANIQSHRANLGYFNGPLLLIWPVSDKGVPSITYVHKHMFCLLYLPLSVQPQRTRPSRDYYETALRGRVNASSTVTIVMDPVMTADEVHRENRWALPE